MASLRASSIRVMPSSPSWAAIAPPALTKAKSKAQGVPASQRQQMMMAWRLYVDDNQDKVPPAYGNGNAPGLMVGWILLTAIQQLEYRTRHQKSLLWPYCGNSAGIWKCPADKSTVKPTSGPFAGQIVPRVRSISMAAGSTAATWGFRASRIQNLKQKLRRPHRPGPEHDLGVPREPRR